MAGISSTKLASSFDRCCGRLLLLCPGQVASKAVAATEALWPTLAAEGRVDLLRYGAGSDGGLPAGTESLFLPPPVGSPLRKAGQALRFVWEVRRRRYAVGVLAQPSIGRSRARGLLLMFPVLVGAGEVLLLDPDKRAIIGSVKRSTAIIDFGRWCVLQPVAVGLAAVATLLIPRRPRPGPTAARAMPAAGAVVYLRSDIELAGSTLQAGGSAAHTEGIVRALGRRGHTIEFWSTGAVAGMPTNLKIQRLPVISRANLPTEISELGSSVWQVIVNLRRHRRPAFVYQRYSLNNLTGVLLAAWWGTPLIIEANASEAKWRQDWSTLRFAGLAQATERFVLSRADRIAVVSDNAAADLEAAGAAPERLRVTPNAAEVERFAGARPKPLPFTAGTFVICFAGLFYPWHGVGYLAEAFAGMARDDTSARLLLIGDGQEAGSVRATLARADVLEAVHMPGLVPRSEIPSYLAASDVLVSPHADIARFIGSPVKIFEYMAAGKAIVASRVAQISQILRDRESALLVAPGDPDSLRDALVLLRSDPTLRRRLGDTAQTEAREHHSWDARIHDLLGPS